MREEIEELNPARLSSREWDEMIKEMKSRSLFSLVPERPFYNFWKQGKTWRLVSVMLGPKVKRRHNYRWHSLKQRQNIGLRRKNTLDISLGICQQTQLPFRVQSDQIVPYKATKMRYRFQQDYRMTEMSSGLQRPAVLTTEDGPRNHIRGPISMLRRSIHQSRLSSRRYSPAKLPQTWRCGANEASKKCQTRKWSSLRKSGGRRWRSRI